MHREVVSIVHRFEPGEEIIERSELGNRIPCTVIRLDACEAVYELHKPNGCPAFFERPVADVDTNFDPYVETDT